MEIEKNVLISDLTTMRLGGPADYVLTVENRDDVRKAYTFAKERGLPVWILGGGANTIGRDEGFRGIIVLNKIRGINVLREDAEGMEIQAFGGEIWDDLVEFTTKHGCSGIEAMSMIPGTVGAAPVQNIGAYGQDISQVIISLEAYDIRDDKFVNIPRPEMEMQYRHTRFNAGEDAGRFFIVSVVLKLKKTGLKPPFYNSLQAYLDNHGVTDFSPKNIRTAVCEIRSQKLPDPKRQASAGSFFKNIYLEKRAADIAERDGIPIWRDKDGGGKVNSGWLIEQCGLKGKSLFGFRVSEKAALVLINEDAKTYADLEKARSAIIDAVRKKFGFVLEQEPVEIPSGEMK